MPKRQKRPMLVFPIEKSPDEIENAAVFVVALVSGSEAFREKLRGKSP